MLVYVVTNATYGWDCVVGVYHSTLTQDDLAKAYPEEDGFVISSCSIASEIEKDLLDSLD